MAGCSTRKLMDLAPEDSSKADRPSDFWAGEDGGDSPSSGQEDYEEEGSKIITTMDLNLETTEFDSTMSKLKTSLKNHKGYIENSHISYDQYYNGKNYKYGNLKIRIPKESLDRFKSDLSGFGNLLSENTYKEDVTKSYRDTESRLKVITTKEDRILSLLEKAEKLEDIIALEDQLTEIIMEKEELQASILSMDDQIDYSTINVDIREVEKLKDKENIETGFGQRIKNAFNNSLYGFNIGIQNFIIWLIYALPFIIILAIFLYLLYRIVKRMGEKNKS